jgi:archaellum component FlaC
MAKRITTQELKNDVIRLHDATEQIKKEHLTHIHECIHRLEDNVKDNRNYFEDRLNRLDNRIFWILGMVLTTLVTLLATVISSNM